MKVRFLVLLVGVAAAAAACADPFATKATLPTIDDTAAVFALTGAPESAPTAINITFPRARDHHAERELRRRVRHPARLGRSSIRRTRSAPTLTAGLQLSSQPFDAITKAPTTGYNDTSVVFVKAGDVVLVRSTSAQCSSAGHHGAHLSLREDRDRQHLLR